MNDCYLLAVQLCYLMASILYGDRLNFEDIRLEAFLEEYLFLHGIGRVTVEIETEASKSFVILDSKDE